MVANYWLATSLPWHQGSERHTRDRGEASESLSRVPGSPSILGPVSNSSDLSL